jgi:4-oxalocrotonate tautomerase
MLNRFGAPAPCRSAEAETGVSNDKGQREVEMPFVNIRIVREVIASDPEGKKAAIASKVAAAIVEAAGVGKDDVWVVFEEVAARDWYVGATNVETRRRGAK